jgi:hypothetical protein
VKNAKKQASGVERDQDAAHAQYLNCEKTLRIVPGSCRRTHNDTATDRKVSDSIQDLTPETKIRSQQATAGARVNV